MYVCMLIMHLRCIPSMLHTYTYFLMPVAQHGHMSRLSPVGSQYRVRVRVRVRARIRVRVRLPLVGSQYIHALLGLPGKTSMSNEKNEHLYIRPSIDE
jgi:hypothetical protein